MNWWRRTWQSYALLPNNVTLAHRCRRCFGISQSAGLMTKQFSNVYCRNRHLSSRKPCPWLRNWRLQCRMLKELQGEPVATSQREVHKVTSQPAFQNRGRSDGFKGRLTSACYRCGKSGHEAYQCKFKSAVCYKCGKKSHI